MPPTTETERRSHPLVEIFITDSFPQKIHRKKKQESFQTRKPCDLHFTGMDEAFFPRVDFWQPSFPSLARLIFFSQARLK
jgi:hypothetical protein